MRLPVRDDSGSLPVALLLIMVGSSISALLLASSVARTASGRHTMQRQALLAAAQAGLDVAVARIRDTGGARTSLPCNTLGGTVNVNSRLTYSVTITYRKAGNSPWSCASAATALAPPAFADLTSIGADPATKEKRTMTARYTLRSLINPNIAGGLVPMTEKLGVDQVCLDAGSATPVSGTPVFLKKCVAGSKQQTFAYNAKIQLALVSSYSDLTETRMCVDGGSNSNTAVTMRPCVKTGSVTTWAPQQWSINDQNQYQGTLDGIQLNGKCLGPTTRAPNTPVIKIDCPDSGNPLPGYQSVEFNPDVSVGAGAAGPVTDQLINYYAFGRCLDVPNYTWDTPYMWIWPCKQAPTPAGVSWNQKWEIPDFGTSGYIVNYPGGDAKPTPNVKVCLKAPTTVGGFVTLVDPCPIGTATGAFRWTPKGDTGVYKDSFTIVDSTGANCLSMTTGTINAWGHDVTQAITVPCSGSTREKWNADPDALKPSPLTEVAEQ